MQRQIDRNSVFSNEILIFSDFHRIHFLFCTLKLKQLKIVAELTLEIVERV